MASDASEDSAQIPREIVKTRTRSPFRSAKALVTGVPLTVTAPAGRSSPQPKSTTAGGSKVPQPGWCFGSTAHVIRGDRLIADPQVLVG